jgi:hypothetical protein
LWFDSLRAFHTTDKRPAFPLVSRLYRIGYNALAVLVILPPLPSLDPLSGQAFRFDYIQLLRYADIPHSVLNKRNQSDISE